MSEEVKKLISDVKSIVGKTSEVQRTQAEELAITQRALADLEKAFSDMRKTQLKAADFESSSDREIKDYIHSDAVVKSARSKYFSSSDGAIQLVQRQFSHDDGTTESRYGLLDDPSPKNEWQRDLQQLVDRRSIIRKWSGDRPTSLMDRQIERHMRLAPAPIRRIFADNAGSGAEWIPDNMYPQLERDVEIDRRVEALFGTIPIPAGGVLQKPYLETGLKPSLQGTPSTDDPAKYRISTVSTAQRTVTAAKLAVRTQVDPDTAEDSLIAYEPKMREELRRAIVDGIEDAIINGDTAASHQDAIASWDIADRWGTVGLGGSDDHRRAWIGLRARAYDVSATTDSNAQQTAARMVGMRSDLTNLYGAAEGDLVYIANHQWVMSKILTDDNVFTHEKYGPNATILTGEIARIGNIPVIYSMFMTSDLASTGLYTGSGNTAGLLLVNRRRFDMHPRRGQMFEMQKDVARGVVDMVVTIRTKFDTIDSSSTKNVQYDYNLTL